MENFTDLDAVAAEELSIAQFSSEILANKDLCDEKYLKTLNQLKTYDADGMRGAHRYSLAAAVTVAQRLGLSAEQIKSGLANVRLRLAACRS